MSWLLLWSILGSCGYFDAMCVHQQSLFRPINHQEAREEASVYPVSWSSTHTITVKHGKLSGSVRPGENPKTLRRVTCYWWARPPLRTVKSSRHPDSSTPDRYPAYGMRALLRLRGVMSRAARPRKWHCHHRAKGCTQRYMSPLDIYAHDGKERAKQCNSHTETTFGASLVETLQHWCIPQVRVP